MTKVYNNYSLLKGWDFGENLPVLKNRWVIYEGS